MNTTTHLPVPADLENTAATDVPIKAAAPTKTELYAAAEARMQRGKRLVISGFIVAVFGIIAYSAISLTAAVNPEIGAALLDNPRWFAAPSLGIIALGTLLWLVGSFIHLSGAMESDPDGPDVYF